MIVLSLNNITLMLGAKQILQTVSLEIQDGQRIGLIGSNGAGKSSLFRLIMGEYQPESGGSITRLKNISIGYLPQHPELDPHLTALQAALSGNQRILELTSKLEHLEASLGDPEVYANEKRLAAALEKQAAYLEEYQKLGGNQFPERVKTTLLGLGLAPHELKLQIKDLSGGKKKLVALTRTLLANPNVLLLDEPDNHLDLAGKAYLEQLIRAYPGAVVLISHDRYLLDAVVTHIADLEDGQLSLYNTDYSTYYVEKQERLARQEELYNIQQREITRIEKAIQRYAIWAKTYDSEKFAKRAHAIQNRLDKMERIERPVLERRRMDLRLNGWRGSSKVLELQHVSMAFDSQLVFDDLNLLLYHGQRLGIIGENGAGKSVLLQLILGKLQPTRGDIIIGPSVKIGYYAQEHETLDFNQTVLDSIRLTGNMSESAAAAFLNRHLFSYRQVHQKISQLSGGERSRLQLAQIVLTGCNFLILDEPTNNLDIPSAEVLETALNDFEGTVLIVSHDRYFLDQTVDQLLVLSKQGRLEFPGAFSDFLASSLSHPYTFLSSSPSR